MKTVTGGLAIAIALLATIGVFGPTVARAHAVLLGSNPESKQQLDASPQELELRFNENVGPVFFKVLDRTGADVGAPGPIRIDGNNLHLPLGEALANGTYVMTWRVISADTHPVGGSLVFSVGEPIAEVSAAPVATASKWVLPVAVNRVLLYGSVLLAVGSALLLLLMQWPESLRASVMRQGRLASIVALVTFVLAIGLGGADILAGGAGALFSGATWAAGAKSTLGVSAVLGVIGAIATLFAFARGAVAALWVGVALLVGSFLVTGHAATAAPVWLMATNVAVHLVGGGFWLAALVPLARSTRLFSPAESGALMHQFSSRAVWLVGLLLVSGIVITWVQVQSPSNLFTTDYGIRLAFKMLAVLALLGFALMNRQRFTPALSRGEAAAASRMRRSIGAEIGLMAFIVIAAASLTLPSPPRALAAQAAGTSGAAGSGAMQGEGFKATWVSGDYRVEVDVTPARAGENMIMLQFKDTSGAAVPMVSASIEAALPAASIGGIEMDGETMSPGMFHFMVGEMIVPGEWELKVNAFVTDFDKIVFSGAVPIG